MEKYTEEQLRKLEAAAPLMYEALISAKELIGCFRLNKQVATQEVWEKIEEALKKATE